MVYQLTRRLLLTLCLLPVAVQAAGNEEAAASQVERFHQALLTAMTLPEQMARENALAEPVAQVFALERIAAISLGRTWRSLDIDQREHFVAQLAQLIVATYADRFAADKGHVFVLDEVSAVKNGFVVRTRLVRRDDKPVALDYLLRDNQIFNVIADGVSDLSLRRADYSSIIKNEGYEQLLVHIEDKIAQARQD